MDSNEIKNIVVIGGGIIGCTTAYFLTRHPAFDPKIHKITLLEATKIAGGASGKAGGLLALWAYPSNIVPLSYRLHAELAKEHNGAERWGYRWINCGQVDAQGRHPPAAAKNGAVAGEKNGKASVSLQKRSEDALSTLRKSGFPKDLDWLAPDSALSFDEMGGPDTTAQVHPLLFTTAMAELAESAGVKIQTGARVTSINPSKASNPSVESVTYTTSQATSETISADRVVLAAGPWTARILPSAPIGGLRAHSVTIKPTRPVSAFALFTSISLPAGFGNKKRPHHVSPEIYARPNNEVYACGEGDRFVPLPDDTSSVQVDQSRCQDIIDHVGSISDELRDGEVTARQACYLPVCEGGGGPFIGEVRDMSGLILASGHSCWGIQNAPGTAQLVSELVIDGKVTSAKLGQLDPKRGM